MVISEILKPNTSEEAYRILTSPGKNYLVGGGAWMKLTVKDADKIISLDGIGLNEIIEKADTIEIGSMVTLRDIETNPSIKNLCDGILAQAAGKIMGINIRNIATIGGTVMGKLAFSDLYPPLLALGAKLVFHQSGEISFAEFLEKPKFDKDILLKVIITKSEGKGYFKKVATTLLDFAIINCAIVRSNLGFRISIGATPYTAKLADEAMAYLNSCRNVGDMEIQTAVQIAMEEIKTSDNLRASKEYRNELIKTYLTRGLRQVTKHVG